MHVPGELQERKWNQNANLTAKNGPLFSTVLLVRTSLYFMNRNYFIMASSIQKIKPTTPPPPLPHPSWEVSQITKKKCLFSVKPITLTYYSSLINLVTNKFYFRILALFNISNDALYNYTKSQKVSSAYCKPF